MIHDHAAQAQRVHAAMKPHKHHISYHDSHVKIIPSKLEPRVHKSKLAIHTNHNPGIAGTDEVMR